jgi:hypothetical protein
MPFYIYGEPSQRDYKAGYCFLLCYVSRVCFALKSTVKAIKTSNMPTISYNIEI